MGNINVKCVKNYLPFNMLTLTYLRYSFCVLASRGLNRMMTISCGEKKSGQYLNVWNTTAFFFPYQIKDVDVIFKQLLERDNELLVETVKMSKQKKQK